MTVLVLADHDESAVTQPTRSAIAAAAKLGDVHVLVLGTRAAADAAAKVAGVAKVLHTEDALYGNALAEPVAALLVALAPEYSHLLAPASAAGKNVMPRVAALLDVQVISDIAGGGGCRYLRAADLCRQRDGDGEVRRSEEGHHGPRGKLRSGRRPRAAPPRSRRRRPAMTRSSPPSSAPRS